MQTAALLNNYGASSLLARRRAAAPLHSISEEDEHKIQECFSSSISMVRRELTNASNENHASQRQTPSCAWSVAVYSLPGLPQESDSHHTSLFVYGNVFEILLDPKYELLLEEEDLPSRPDEMSAVIMFNMALFFHTQALSSHSQDALSRAARLYELLLKMVGGNSFSSFSALLRIVTLNNVGALQYAQGDSQKAYACFSALYQLLQHPESCEGWAMMQETERSEIAANCMFMMYQQEIGDTICARAA